MFLKVTIPGDYWDVQVYRGKLHLWTMDGSILTVNWTNLVEELAESARSRIAVRFALSDGRALYQMRSNALWTEPEFQSWLRGHFGSQAEQSFDLDHQIIRRHQIAEQASLIPELPIDSEIYNRQLYTVASCGIWKASVDKGTVLPISTRWLKLHDLSAVSISARSNQLALAATGDGLFRLGTGEGGEWTHGFEQVLDRHCDKADWVFQSMFAGSTIDGAHLVSRYWERHDRSEFASDRQYVLRDGGTYPISEINGALDSPGASWAFAEKIYTADEQRLTSTQYTQHEITEGIGKASVALGELALNESHGRPIEGKAGVFGTVVEFDRGLQVVLSNEEQISITGPVTRWRTYPRANNYENHLHVILDNCLEVFAFFTDFFEDQDQKKFGVKFDQDERTSFTRSFRNARRMT